MDTARQTAGVPRIVIAGKAILSRFVLMELQQLTLRMVRKFQLHILIVAANTTTVIPLMGIRLPTLTEIIKVAAEIILIQIMIIVIFLILIPPMGKLIVTTPTLIIVRPTAGLRR